jgi:hypothetical protein
MQVIINKDFSVAVVEPSAVFQNSQNASVLSVFAPFSVSQYGLIELYVTLPNGEILPPYVAFGNLNESEIAQGLGTWSLSLDSKFTQLSGRVVMSLAFYGGTPEIDTEGKPTYPTVATTGEFSIMILPSVTGTLPATLSPDVYEQILTEITTLISRTAEVMNSLAGKSSVTIDGVFQPTYDASNVASLTDLTTQLEALKTEIENTRGYILENGSAKFSGDVYANVNKLLATTEYVQQQIAALVNGAPETLDTLKELGDAIKENETVLQALDAAITNKLDKIPFTESDENKTVRVGSNGGLVAADVSYISNPEGMEFSSNNGEEYRVASYTGSLTDIIIPNTCNGKPITVIDTAAFDGAYSNNTLLTSVVISEGIKRIENGAFASQTNLKSITIPHSVNFIANTAFSDTGIKDIYLPWSESEMPLTGAPWGAKAVLHYAVPESIGALQKYANNTFANALKGNVQGTAVALTNVSPVPQNVDIVVYSGKNFLNSNPQALEQFSMSGSGNTYWGVKSHLPAGTYTFSAVSLKGELGTDGYIYLWCPIWGQSHAFIYKDAYNTTPKINNLTTTFKEEVDVWLYNAFSSGTEENTEDLLEDYNFQCNAGTSVEEYTPYIEVSSVKILKLGKNLLNESSISKLNFNDSSGTPITRYGFSITLSAGTYTVHAEPKNASFDEYIYGQLNTAGNVFKQSVNTVIHTSLATVTFTAEDGDILYIFNAGAGNGNENETVTRLGYFNFQIELGSNATSYEPYIAPTEYAVNSDGTVAGFYPLIPNTTLLTDTEGVLITAEYNKDINRVFEELYNAIISLGGNL